MLVAVVLLQRGDAPLLREAHLGQPLQRRRRRRLSGEERVMGGVLEGEVVSLKGQLSALDAKMDMVLQARDERASTTCVLPPPPFTRTTRAARAGASEPTAKRVRVLGGELAARLARAGGAVRAAAVRPARRRSPPAH